jgi:hypothetical protein
MLRSIDLCGVETKSADFLLLQTYLQQLVGQPFLQFRFSYGDELSLHFGQPRPYSTQKLKHLVKGSYILGTRASRWFFRSGTAPVVILGAEEVEPDNASGFKPLSKEALEKSEVVPLGARIVVARAVPSSFPLPGNFSTVRAFGCGLSLYLSDGSSLWIAPETDAPPPAENEIADWELFTPYDRYLRVGPGMWWSYLPSRQPLSSQPAERGGTSEQPGD